MSYFNNFPQILYSFDTGQSVSAFTMTDILLRVKTQTDSNGLLAYDEYDIQDGETPEILADKFYNDSTLHWIILLTNDIIDPRWEWPLDQQTLLSYVDNKYGVADRYTTHHWENTSGDTVYFKTFTGTVNAAATAGSSISVTGTGTAFLTEIPQTGIAVRFNASTTAYTVVAVNSDTSITVSGSAITTALSAASMLDNYSHVGSKTEVTNYDHEFTQNETKRRINILKPQFINNFINNFTGILNNGGFNR